MNVEKDHRPDEDIVKSIQSGVAADFGVIVDRYEEKLKRYGRKFLKDKEDLKDMVQDIFIRAYQNIQSYDPGLRFSPWLYRIAHNIFIDKIKKESRSPLSFVDFDVLLSHPVYDDRDKSEAEMAEMRQMIEHSLDAIEPKYREVIVLYYLEEIPYKEIADILSIPVGTVGIRLKRGRDALKKVMDKNKYGNE